MKDRMISLFSWLRALVRRFKASQPRGPYEGILFGAIRSVVSVAFFPPGLKVRPAPLGH